MEASTKNFLKPRETSIKCKTNLLRELANLQIVRKTFANREDWETFTALLRSSKSFNKIRKNNSEKVLCPSETLEVRPKSTSNFGGRTFEIF